ncbi:MAG: DMT family transporter [Gammaproteobacteria bacterium]|jgi:drug/metabolite transporter (DMT)-like permease
MEQSPAIPRSAALVGAGLVLIAAMGFSAKAIFIKLAYRYHVDPVTLLALRMSMSLPFFLLAAVWSRRERAPRLKPREWVSVVFLGVIGYYLASLFDFLGLQYVTAGLERLVLFLYPTLVVLITVIRYRRPIAGRELVALTLSYGGIAFVFLHDLRVEGANVPLGTGLVFASALAYALYLVGAGEVVHRIGTLRFTAYVMTVSCAAVLAQFLVTEPLGALYQPGPVYGLSAAMALLSTVMPAFLLTAGIRRIGARNASMIGAVGPVSTIALAAVFLGEPVSAVQLFGAALVLIGVITVSVGRRAV